MGEWQLTKKLAQGFSCRAPLGVSCSHYVYVCMVGGGCLEVIVHLDQSPLSWPPGITLTWAAVSAHGLQTLKKFLWSGEGNL